MLEEFRRRLPGREVALAFSSVSASRSPSGGFPDVETALRQFQKPGVSRVVLQSLHIMPGLEFDKLARLECPGLEICLGRPLLDAAEDREQVAAALSAEFAAAGANVLVGHGNERPGGNETLSDLERICRKRCARVRLCTLKGDPGLEAFAEVRALAAEGGQVRFVPLMLVAGAHVLNDVMGDGPESWKSRLGVALATCAGPLGENSGILDLFCRHIATAGKN